MAISNTIQSMYNNVDSAYTSLSNKGATIPADKNLANLANTIDSIPSGVQIYHIEQIISGDNCTLSITEYTSQLTDNYLVAVYQENNTQEIYILREVS